MTTMVLDRAILPEQLLSFFTSPRVAVTQRSHGEVTLTPVIDPADYDNDTDYLLAIPGMKEKLLEGMNTPLSECISHDELWDDDITKRHKRDASTNRRSV